MYQKQTIFGFKNLENYLLLRLIVSYIVEQKYDTEKFSSKRANSDEKIANSQRRVTQCNSQKALAKKIHYDSGDIFETTMEQLKKF